MLLGTLKNKILKRRFAKLIKAYTQKRVVTHKEIKTVAVLTSHEVLTSHNFKNQLLKLLGVNDLKIYTYQKFDKKKKAPESYFSEQDFGIQGKISNTDFKRFLVTPFDLLITYFTDENEYLEFATLLSRATFKVGFANVNPDLFDMEIVGTTNNLEEFNSELTRYLKLLNKIKLPNKVA